MLSLVILCIFAFVAGFVDAIAGGGGLIQMPAMFILQPQLSLVQVLATNKTASFSGTTVAAVRYIKKVDIDWRHISPMMIATLTAAFAGALMVSHIDKEQYMPFIISALLLVLAYTILKREFGLHHKVKPLSQTRYLFYAVGMGGLLGFYEGAIGPGTGSFLLFAFISLFGYDFLHASANAKIINLTASSGALVFFIAKGFVVWSIAIPVGICNMLGSYTGAHVAIKKGSWFIRVFFIIMALALIIKLSYDYL